MTFALADLITPSTPEELLELLLAIAASLEAPTTSWQEGDPTLTQFMTFAQKMADSETLSVEIAKGGFGELLPSDAWADRWAWSRFKVARVAATPAPGYLDLVCDATATADTYGPGEIIVAHATTNKTYRNTEDVTIVPGTTVEDQPFVADETGIGSNAAPSTLTVMVSSLVGVEPTNPESFLGTDQETTPHLVARAIKKLGALSPNGPKDAYDFVATSPEHSATSVPITRTNTVLDEATGELSTYLATATGAPTAPDVAIVQTAIDDNAEPWGSNDTAIAADEVVQAVTYQAWVRDSNLTDAELETAIESALVEYFATLDLGGDVIPPDAGMLYVEALEQVIGHAATGITRVVVTIPAAAVPLDPNEVVVLGAVTPTITRL